MDDMIVVNPITTVTNDGIKPRPGFKYVHTVTEQDAADIQRLGFAEWLRINHDMFEEVADKE